MVAPVSVNDFDPTSKVLVIHSFSNDALKDGLIS